ncbi:EAL domain-containing protein [Paramagnetospirillum marisnigri]|nr:EAL domain-containing protein [Paramagnetospirillum marisnigri]
MFRLLRHFSMVSAVMVLLSAVLLAQAYHWDQTREHVALAEDGNRHIADSFTGTFWKNLLPMVSALGHAPPGERRNRGEVRALDIALRSMIGGQPILKIKIFDANGSILYSPQPGEIGQSDSANLLLRAALAGRISSVLAHKPHFEGFGDPVNDRWVVETYLPLRGQSGEIEAIFELYSDVTATRERLSESTLKATLLILACFLCLYLALVLVIRRADHVLRSQTRELEGSRESLREQKETLRHLLDAAGEGIVGFDGQARVTFINPAAIELIGCDADATIGRDAHALFHHSLSAAPHGVAECDIVKAVTEGKPGERRSGQFCRQDGGVFPVEYVVTPKGESGRASGAVMLFRDVSKVVEQERHLQRLAHFDSLTQLPNRLMLADRMRLAMAATRRSNGSLAICMLDLDGFKPINDTHGHKAGDQLLREVARRLLENIRAEDTAARLGGDEFALLLGGIETTHEYEVALQRILKAISSPYQVSGATVRVSASIGVTLFPNDGVDADVLLRHADQAMYKAKQSGKNCYALFDPSADQRRKANSTAIRKMASAIESGQFLLHYQPLVDCRRGRVRAAEALVRWNHPLMGLLAPGEFLPLIEHDDLIVQLGERTIADALAQIEAWRVTGLEMDVAVNISARQLHQRDFLDHLDRLLAPYPPETVRHLKLEIVETAALDDINAVADIVTACQRLGIRFSLDDFGTGYSSLIHLKRLAPAALKIDQTFIADMLDDSMDLAIVEGVVGMAQAFRCDIVAEGVESIDQILMLLELGCDNMQGFGLSRPLPPDSFQDWVRQFTPDPRWKLASTGRPNRAEFQLLLAEANHRHWVDRLIAYAEGDQGEPPPSTDHRACRFGEWYYGGGFKNFGGYKTFGDIEAQHTVLHELGIKLLAQARSGDTAAVHATVGDLILARDGLIDALRRVRGTVSQPRHLPTPP